VTQMSWMEDKRQDERQQQTRSVSSIAPPKPEPLALTTELDTAHRKLHQALVLTMQDVIPTEATTPRRSTALLCCSPNPPAALQQQQNNGQNLL